MKIREINPLSLFAPTVNVWTISQYICNSPVWLVRHQASENVVPSKRAAIPHDPNCTARARHWARYANELVRLSRIDGE